MGTRRDIRLLARGSAAVLLAGVLVAPAVPAVAAPGDDGALVVSSDSTLDTLTGILQPGGRTLGHLDGGSWLVELTTLQVDAGATLRFTAAHPVVLSATGAITVDGTIDASASGGVAGPGGGTPGAVSGSSQYGGGGGGGASGGGGGGFTDGLSSSRGGNGGGTGGMGGAASASGCGGGAGTSGLGTLATAGACRLSGVTAAGGGGGGGGGFLGPDGVLRGGSGGGAGASTQSYAGGSGGAGGGALTLRSDVSVSVAGAVLAAGTPGLPAAGGVAGSGGAGGGGAVLLRAPVVSVAGRVDAGTPAVGGFTADGAGGGRGAAGGVYVQANCFPDAGNVTPARQVTTYDGGSGGLVADDTAAVDEDTTLTVGAPGLLANDACASSATLGTPPAHGTATVAADGSYTYVPAANFAGTDSFTYGAVLSGGGSASGVVTVTVRPVDDAPVAQADAYTVTAGTSLDVAAPGVLADDTDVEADPLTAVLVTAPAHGSLTLNADGSFTYVPVAGFVGTDAFQYQADDGTLRSATATATVEVQPAGPKLSATVLQPINVDGSSTFSVKRGVVPVKFSLTADGVATCQLPSATLRLTLVSGATGTVVDESVYAGAADSGSSFRISDCQYVYNLSAGGLGVGTYRVDVLVDGSSVGAATFRVR